MTSSHHILSIVAELLGPGAHLLHSAWQRVQNLLYSHHTANAFIGVYAFFYFLPHLRPWIDCWKQLFAAVHVEESQDFYATLLDWTSARLGDSSTLKLVITDDINRIYTEKDSGGRFHGANMQRSMEYQPWYGLTWFWYNRTLFIVERQRNRSASYVRPGDEEILILRTPGLSARPIKDLFDSIAASAKPESQRTSIFTIRPKPARTFAGPWFNISSLPIRPMQSVALDQKIKMEIVDEINDFLQPSHALACRERGIPWRRGYLFHGPPGTGKTSFVKAIAGTFGIPIYILSLHDSDVEDADLLQILPRVPPRCMVLIEDIDTFDVAGSRTISAQEQLKAKSGNVSLSALLNALDGITSPNGCILVMTTNFPDKLDEALTRPGRVDREVYFPLITKALAQEMFLSRYREKQDGISLMAEQFQDAIPSGILSPAHVQEFLFAREPMNAIERAKAHKAGE